MTSSVVFGFAQKPIWSSFVKICQCLGVAQCANKFFFFNLNICGLQVEPMISLVISTVFGSCCLVHGQQENFLHQSYQKLHYKTTATSIINTKLLHIFRI